MNILSNLFNLSAYLSGAVSALGAAKAAQFLYNGEILSATIATGATLVAAKVYANFRRASRHHL